MPISAQRYSLGIEGTSWNLVHRNRESGKFEPVDQLASDVSSDELDKNYGIWMDKRVTERHWLVLKKEVRPADGQIQDDEVRDFKDFRSWETSWVLRVGEDDLYTCDWARITAGGDAGKPQLDTGWTQRHAEWNRWQYQSSNNELGFRIVRQGTNYESPLLPPHPPTMYPPLREPAALKNVPPEVH